MSSPFPLEEAAQQDTGQPVWDPWKSPAKPDWYAGFGYTEDTAYLGPTYRLAAMPGAAAAKGELLLGGALHAFGYQDPAALAANYQTPDPILKKLDAAGEVIKADAKERLKALTPDPATTGSALQTLHGLGEGVSTALVGSALGGLPGAFGALSTTEGNAAYESLRDQGVAPGTAGSVATVRGLLAGAGAVTPMVFGASLLPRLVTGAASNVAFGTVGRAADSELLRRGGYDEMADQEATFDRSQMLIDAALGIGFGGWAHVHAVLGGEANSKKLADLMAADPALRDAALTANLALRDRAAGPGVPVTPGDANANVAAIERVLQQVQNEEKANVAGTGVEDSTVILRGGTDNPEVGAIIEQALRESGVLEHAAALDQLEGILGRKLAGEPEPKPITVPDRLDARNFGLPDIPETLPAGDDLLRPHWDPKNSELQDTTPEREAMREKLIAQRFAGVTPVADGEQPVAVFLGGGGASGKGTLVKYLRRNRVLSDNAVHLDPDEFKTGNGKNLDGIPEFQSLDAAKDGRGARVTHEESSLLFQRARQRATGGSAGTGPKYHLILDRTLGDPDKARAEIQALKTAGYKVILHGVTVHPEVAVERAVERATKSNRWVPLNALLKAHKGFSLGFESYAHLADEATLYDNNVPRDADPVPIAEQRQGTLAILRPQEYNQFVEKGALNDQATTLRQIREPAQGERVREERARADGEARDAGGASGLAGGSGGTGSAGAGPEAVRPDRVPGQRLETVSTAAGRQVETRARVAELGDLITSDHPAFPPALQPRERGERRVLDQQVREIAANLVPERLGSSPEADRGAPIVSPQNEVESGNGRVMALRQVYAGNPEKAAAYRAFLEAQGHDVSAMKQPVLVRERLTPMNDAERAAFALEANQSATASLSAVERGRADARRLDTDTLSMLADGEIDSRANQPFARAFLDGIPLSERAGLLNPDGSLNQDGIRRIQAAILTKAYGGTEHSAAILGRMLESTEGEQRNLLGALLDAAPAFARLRQMVSDGVLGEQYDVTERVLAAIEDAKKLRESGQSLSEHLSQADMLTPRDPVQDAILKAFYDKAGKRAAGRAKIKDALIDYVNRATAQRLDQGNLFGDVPLSADRLLEATLAGRKEEAAPPQSQDMFGLRTPQGGKKTEAAPSPAQDLATQALIDRPNLTVLTDEGVVPAVAAKLAADEAAERTEGIAPALFKAATDCALRNGL